MVLISPSFPGTTLVETPSTSASFYQQRSRSSAMPVSDLSIVQLDHTQSPAQFPSPGSDATTIEEESFEKDKSNNLVQPPQVQVHALGTVSGVLL